MADKKRNALKHGANGSEVMLWGEKYKDYKALSNGLCQEFSPSGSTEGCEAGRIDDDRIMQMSASPRGRLRTDLASFRKKLSPRPAMLKSRMENRCTRWRKSNVQTIRVASLRNKAIAFCGFRSVSDFMPDHFRHQIYG